MKFAELFPLVTVTLAGTVAATELDERPTTIPAAGAGPFRVTVPVELEVATTVPGFTERLEIVNGFNVSAAVAKPPAMLALIVAVVNVLT